MMSDSGKHRDFSAKRGRTACWKRLEVRRMKSERLMENFRLEIQGPFAGGGRCCPKKRGRGFKVVPNFDSRSAAEKASMVDDGVGSPVPELSLSASGSSESLGPSLEGSVPPVGILVAGGEVCEEEELNSLTCLSHGSISVIGRRRSMEDAVTVEPGIVAGEFSFFAVYDGHGGSRVANACRDRLHQLLVNELKGRTSSDNPTGIGVSGGGGLGVGIEWEKVMMACFAKMDDEVSGSNSGGPKEEAGASVHSNTVGSTAAVVIVGKDEVVVANCGDSRVVLGRGGIAVPLSCDHKPDRPDERERVEARGGRVINWNGSRVLGVLATSRSIGDHYLKPYVIAEPEVIVSKRTESDNFLIIASDGLWDVVSNEVACNVVRRCLDGQMRKRFSEGTAATEAAAMLAGLAMAKGSADNISVVVVEL